MQTTNSSSTTLPPLRAMPSLGLLLKAAIGLGLFVFIAMRVDLGAAFAFLRRAEPWAFLTATLLILFQHVFAAQRWTAVLKACGQRLPARTAFLAYLEANFFNQAMPSTIGGDAVRLWRSCRAGLAFGPAAVGVILDRAFGLVVLALLALIGSAALWGTAGGHRTGVVLAIGALLIVAVAIAGGLLSTFAPALARWNYSRWLHSLSEGVRLVVTQPPLAAKVIGHSLIGHLITVVAFERLAASLGLPIGLEGALKALPAILLASAIPISIGGWGVREGAGVAILTGLGLMGGEQALALALLLGLSLLVIGLIGGVIWLLDDDASFAALRDPERALLRAVQPDDGSGLSERKRTIRAFADARADTRDAWIAANPAYFDDDRNFMRFIVRQGARVLELGCATGDLLARLEPSRGVGIDLSKRMIDMARTRHPALELVAGDVEDPALIASLEGPFDYIVMSDTIGLLDDLEKALAQLHPLCNAETRLVIAYHSHLWEPILFLAERIGLRQRQPKANFISRTDFENVLYLSDFEPIRTEWRQLIPKRLLGIGTFINRFIATLPLVRRLCLRRYIVARSLKAIRPEELTVSVLIPCRNERGNIEPAVRRLPRFGKSQEIVFVEGNSSDDTFAECLRVKEAYPDRDIKVVKQEGRGKGDAMRKAYATATGDVLMILDADLSVPPEMMARFYEAIASGKGEFINGSRLIYPMQDEAMRPLNFIANRIFALLFTYLLNQRFTDTLCGTKVFRRRSYERISAGRAYFGDFDPFGDFDLIFGATKQSLRIVEIPVHYKARTYGETQISRFRDGLLLLRMVLFAWRKLKAI